MTNAHARPMPTSWSATGWSPASAQRCAAMRSKDQVRRDVWRAMDREGVSRFPGAEGRIPNFAGAKDAAERLAAERAQQAAAAFLSDFTY